MTLTEPNRSDARQLSESSSGEGPASPPPPCAPGYLDRPGAGCHTLAPPPIPAASDADPNFVMGMGVLALVAVIFVIMIIVAVVTVVNKFKAETRKKQELTQRRRQSTMSRDEAVAAMAKLGLSMRDEGSSTSKVGVAAPGAADDMSPTLEKVQSL